MNQFGSSHDMVVINVRRPATRRVCDGPAQGASPSYPVLPLGAAATAEAHRRLGLRVALLDTAVSRGPGGDPVAGMVELMRGPWETIGLSVSAASLPLGLQAVRHFKAGRPLDHAPRVVMGGVGASPVADEITQRFPEVDDVDSAPNPAPSITTGDVLGSGLVDATCYPAPLPVATAIGCPYRCDFCTMPSMGDARRAPHDIADEVGQLVDDYGRRDLFFCDDCFGLDVVRLRATLREFETRDLTPQRSGLRWSCLGHVDSLDEHTLHLMAAAGCEQVELGVESGSAQVLRAMHKGFRFPEALETVRRAARLMTVRATFIFGLPYETPQDFEQTRRAVETILEIDGVEPAVFLATPYPGTPLTQVFADRLEFSEELTPLLFDQAILSAEERSLVLEHPDLFSNFFHFSVSGLAARVEAIRELQSQVALAGSARRRNLEPLAYSGVCSSPSNFSQP